MSAYSKTAFKCLLFIEALTAHRFTAVGAKHAASGRIGKEITLSKSMLFVAERSSNLPNKSLLLLVTWSCATFFYLFFLSKPLLAKIVMVALWMALINRAYMLLNSNTNTSLFSTPHLNQVKR